MQSAASRKSFISCLDDFFFFILFRCKIESDLNAYILSMYMSNENLNFVLFKWCDERPHMLVCNCYSYVYLCLHACYLKIVKLLLPFFRFILVSKMHSGTSTSNKFTYVYVVVCMCIFWFLN